jgi:hypothetical protein
MTSAADRPHPLESRYSDVERSDLGRFPRASGARRDPGCGPDRPDRPRRTRRHPNRQERPSENPRRPDRLSRRPDRSGRGGRPGRSSGGSRGARSRPRSGRRRGNAGRLSNRHGYVVTPVVGVVAPGSGTSLPHDDEVADWFEAPLFHLTRPDPTIASRLLFSPAASAATGRSNGTIGKSGGRLRRCWLISRGGCDGREDRRQRWRAGREWPSCSTLLEPAKERPATSAARSATRSSICQSAMSTCHPAEAR